MNTIIHLIRITIAMVFLKNVKISKRNIEWDIPRDRNASFDPIIIETHTEVSMELK